MRNLLSLEALTGADLRAILDRVAAFKRDRATHARPLAGQTWALIFSKSSTRSLRLAASGPRVLDKMAATSV